MSHSPTPPGPEVGDLVGVADGYERLWTPHRIAYIKGERPTPAGGVGCPF